MKTRLVFIVSKWCGEYSGPSTRLSRLLKDLPSDIDAYVISNSSAGLRVTVGRFENIPFFVVSFLNSLIYKISLLRKIARCIEFIITFIILILKRPHIIHILGRTYSWEAGLIYSIITNSGLILEFVNLKQALYLSINIFGKNIRIKPNPSRTVLVSISNDTYRDIKESSAAVRTNYFIWNRPNPVSLKIKSRSNIYTTAKVEKTTIGCLGKFKDIKNQIFLLKVLKYLPENYSLLVCGPKEEHYLQEESSIGYFEKFCSYMQDLNLMDRVTIYPSFTASEWFFENIDLLVNPSKKEGLGTTVIEALACRMPIVANVSVNSFKQHITDRSTGILLPLNELEWADAIQNYQKIIPEPGPPPPLLDTYESHKLYIQIYRSLQ